MELYERLEVEWATWLGLEPSHMVGCSSGSAALHLACELLPSSYYRAVALPTYTMVACGRAVSLARRPLEFLDVLPDSFLLDPRAWEAHARSYDPAGLMLVHLFGRQCVGDWWETAKRMGTCIIEDLAEAHGVTPHPETFAACWSFYRNKIVAGEEGGAVYFRDLEAAQRARCLRSLGFTGEHDYWHEPYGMNYRLSNAHAELILYSLANYAVNAGRRCDLLAAYQAELPPEWLGPPHQAHWVCDVRLPGLTPSRQARIVKQLNAQGIAARQGFKPLHQQREWVGRGSHWHCPVAEQLASEVLYLPLDPRLEVRDAREIASRLRQAVDETA